MYNDHGKAFVIDDLNNVIYYTAININFKNQCINMRYYAFNLTNGLINKIDI